MTDLKRVREFLRLFVNETGVRIRAFEALDIIDAHLKEDAEREARWETLVSALEGQRDRREALVYENGDEIDRLQAELAELREAVRECLRWATSTAEPHLALDNIAVRLRQLIEEKE